MNTEVSTTFILRAAQNAVCDGAGFLYGMMAPGVVAAILFIAVLVGIGLLSLVFDASTDHDD